ncbi:hypothetical protein HN682_07670, partial [Candidatus Peregrinibacteria bacterium]|nr:hypothetical protein [Candidatus Peregrinibacteria bacterium]
DVLLSDVQTLRDTNARVTMVEQIIARFDITFKSVSLLGQQAYTLLYPILTGLKSVQTEIEGHVLTEKGQKIVTNITNTERTEWIKTLLKHKSTVDTMVSNPLKGQAGGSYGNSINSLLGENNAINNEKLVDINTNYQWLIKYLSGSSEIDDVLFDNVASLKQPADTVVDFSQDLVANFSQNVYSGKFKNFMPSFKEMLYKLNEQRQKDIQIINISKVIRRDLETLPGFNIMLNEVEGINDLLKDSWFSNLSDQLSTGNLALLNAGLQSLSELGCLGTVSSTSNVQDLPIIKEVFGYVYGGSKSALKKVQNYLDRTEEENKTCQAKVTTITDYMQKLENYAAVTPEVPLDITLPT